MAIVIDKELFRKAYKKLKSNIYYDKTQPLLKNAIVEFENNHKHNKLDDYLDSLYEKVNNKMLFESCVDDVCSKINVLMLPKKLKSNKSNIISNTENNNIMIEDFQYYIDMPIEGHIFGVLWIMLLGYRLDKKLYKHSYGNRISKYLFYGKNKQVTSSHHLFEPYFLQYESWRDNGLKKAQELIADENNVVIITLDFKRYYYSLNIDDKIMESIYEETLEDDDTEYVEVCERLNLFIGKVIKEYSLKLGDAFDGRKILPIGFMPSNIIGNWCLSLFDKAIVDRWNPAYYGRYVDDILIVEKLYEDSYITNKIKAGELFKENLIDFYLINNPRWQNFCADTELNGDAVNNSVTVEKDEDNAAYIVNCLLNDNVIRLEFKGDKTRMFYFDWRESSALIECFKNSIARNKSEFRHMPDDEEMTKRNDYTDIYTIVNEESINKFRGIKSIEINKYELSKYVGKYLRVCGLVNDDKKSKFEEELLKIFDYRTIIDNYILWERLIEILVINEHFDVLKSFCKKITDAVLYVGTSGEHDILHIESTRNVLMKYLHVALCRSFALVWSEERIKNQEEIYREISNKINDWIFTVDRDDSLIKGYCDSMMIDKSVMAISCSALNFDTIDNKKGINLSKFRDILHIVREDINDKYRYYPYLLEVEDLCMFSLIKTIKYNGELKNCVVSDEVLKQYYSINYYANKPYFDDIKVCGTPIDGRSIYKIIVGKDKKKKIKIAIANIALDKMSLESVIKNNANRTYERYKAVSKIINESIENNADMLIMPEAYIPLEWLNVLAQVCKKNQMAIVTGVEHIKTNNSDEYLEGDKIYISNGSSKEKLLNLTAVLLPYEHDGIKNTYVNFHLKTQYAPSEIETILGYDMSYKEGDGYEIYKWNDCYFSVYCCYELTSIKDRAIFQSYADMIIAVELNRDVKYYSNIMESFSRDIHAYCIQVNSADYGDSRIIKPCRSDEKDVVRTKGGINPSILIDEIDIDALRNFQIKKYSLQKKDGRFKLTPPRFDAEIAFRKIKGENIFDALQ